MRKRFAEKTLNDNSSNCMQGKKNPFTSSESLLNGLLKNGIDFENARKNGGVMAS